VQQQSTAPEKRFIANITDTTAEGEISEVVALDAEDAREFLQALLESRAVTELTTSIEISLGDGTEPTSA